VNCTEAPFLPPKAWPGETDNKAPREWREAWTAAGGGRGNSTDDDGRRPRKEHARKGRGTQAGGTDGSDAKSGVI
jgi:hypothetical protein